MINIQDVKIVSPWLETCVAFKAFNVVKWNFLRNSPRLCKITSKLPCETKKMTVIVADILFFNIWHGRFVSDAVRTENSSWVYVRRAWRPRCCSVPTYQASYEKICMNFHSSMCWCFVLLKNKANIHVTDEQQTTATYPDAMVVMVPSLMKNY